MALIQSTSTIERDSMKEFASKERSAIQAPPGLEHPPAMLKQKELGCSTVCSQDSSESGSSCAIASILMELVMIVSQLANMDKMLYAVRGNAPNDSAEAEKWHRVSIEALTLSRETLATQQQTILQRLVYATGTGAIPSLSADAATSDFSSSCGLSDKLAKKISHESLSDCSTTASGDDRPECAISSAVDSQDQCSGEFPSSRSLKQDLEQIKEYPAGTVLHVRKIKNLGFDSPTLLKDHFAQFGSVSEVLVAHSITKPTAKRAQGRARPAAMGFVVMANVDDAQKALSAGEQQMIDCVGKRVPVELQEFRG